MRFFSTGKTYDFMKVRWFFIALSMTLTIGSALVLIFGHPIFGTDFRGGTEVEVAFKGPVTTAEVRKAVQEAGFAAPDVIKVEDTRQANHYLIRVQEVSTISLQIQTAVDRALCINPGPDCPPERQATEVKFSPGGDKITARFHELPELDWVKSRLSGVRGISLRAGENNPTIQNPRDHKVEIQLMSKGDQLISGLRKVIGDKVPESALRSEWIGPKAGAQLRDAAIKSIAIAIVFIMAYVAFRFDIRFAPGGVLALVHDALGSAGILVLLHQELNLTTVAAVLTIIGYSVNDTVVIYDRVRENLGKLRGVSFKDLINISTSEMLGRTLLTNFTVQVSLLCFFVWGTGTLKEFALTLTIGMILGTYSSIYVALPITDVLDHWLFSRFGGVKKKPPLDPRAKAPLQSSEPGVSAAEARALSR